MCWLMKQLRSVFNNQKLPEGNGYVDIGIPELERLQRKMDYGSWKFSWKTASIRRLALVQPNIVELTMVTRQAIGLIEAGKIMSSTVKTSPAENGVYEISVEQFMADSDGLYRDPEQDIRELILATNTLYTSINLIGKKSAVRAESIMGQCYYLRKDLEQVFKILLTF